MSDVEPDFFIKQGDTAPSIEYQLCDGNGDPVSIIDADVSFKLRRAKGDQLLINDDQIGNVEILDAANGIVAYHWQDPDTEDKGYYEAEWEVTYSNGTRETFPNSGYLDVYVHEDLD